MKPRDLAIGAAIALAWTAILSSPLAERLRGLDLDTLYGLRDAVYPARHASGESPTAVVAIDEETYQTPPFKGTPKVLWTKHLATVLDALLGAGVKVVGFDIVFPTSVESELRGFDGAMRRALFGGARDGRVVLGFIQHRDKPILPHPGYQVAVGRGRNMRPLNVITDADGVIRRFPLYFKASDKVVGHLPSMSLEMATRYLGKPPEIGYDGVVTLGGFRVPGRADPGVTVAGSSTPVRNEVAARFSRDLGGIPAFSIADLVACAEAGNTEFFRRHFSGKAVMLGTVLDVEDRILSSVRFAAGGGTARAGPRCVLPVDDAFRIKYDRETIPGIYLQATAVNNLVRGEALRELDIADRTVIVGGLALLAALAAATLGPAVSVPVIAGGALLWVAASTHAFSDDLALPLLQPVVAAGLTLASLLGYRFAVADRMGRHIRQAFGHYLAPAVVDRLVEQNRMPEQGGEMREMTVWISDLEKYSTISENFAPTDLVDLLNTVYTVMSDTIEEHRGFVAQFVGDAVVGAFGAPLEDPNHADNAVLSALACVRGVEALNEKVELPRDLRLRIRVGISSGDLLVGNIGSQKRLSYAIVGDDINLSSRLEGANKIYGTQVLANGETVDLCSPDLAFREIDLIRVVGRDTPVRIFEPLGLKRDITEEQQRSLERFAGALRYYYARDFAVAAEIYDSLADRDPAAKALAARCHACVENPPADDWDMVFVLDSK